LYNYARLERASLLETVVRSIAARILALCSSLTLIAAFHTADIAQATDFTIGSGQTVTTTQALDQNETGTVEANGAIATTSDGAHGISANEGRSIVLAANLGTLFRF
jgi:hypothetical protein